MVNGTRASKTSPHVGLLSPHAMDANPFHRVGELEPDVQPAATGTPQAAAPLPAQAPAKDKRPGLQKNDELMTILLETATQEKYYRVQFGGRKPAGSHGKKKEAAARLRALLETCAAFAGRVPTMESLDK